MLIFSKKINMAGNADLFFKKITWPAMLIFSQKINMASHADFYSKN